MLTPAKSRAPARTLLTEVRQLIRSARLTVARAVDAGLVALTWQVGHRIQKDILENQRAGYGEKILQTRSAKLGWSHFQLIIYLDDALRRDFYAEMCRVENWSTRTLAKKIGSMLFERTALSGRPQQLIARELKQLRTADKLSPDLVLRDPYVLDFLGLKDPYAEKDLEAAILREMESFILELGTGFSFVAWQKRMNVGGVDHHLDRLFFHRRLKRLVAIDLKLGAFAPADKGQMELYLAWLRAHEVMPGEDAPLGLILCADKNDETIRLLGLDRGDIRVASFLAEALPQKRLERKLREAVRRARARLHSRADRAATAPTA